MDLYGYFRSSAAYRVRIALNLKGLEATHHELSLLAGDHKTDEYLAINPQGFVPFLKDGDIATGQSMAILEYLEEIYPDVPLLPSDTAGRVRVRALANMIACDVHPLNNLRVLKHLKRELGVGDDARDEWYHHWITEGFKALEAMLQDSATGDFCHGDQPSFADICLLPQIYNARRFKCPLDDFPTIVRIADHCNSLPAFDDALPENQPAAQ